MTLKLRYASQGEFFQDFDVISQHVIISPIYTSIYKISDPIVRVRCIRPHGPDTVWVGIDDPHGILKGDAFDSVDRLFDRIVAKLGLIDDE